MKKIGLALSGGGFRATLYHLGLVRFLRDAGILGNVTHITSVPGRTGKPGTVEAVRGFTEYLAEDSSILAYKLMSVKAGYTYEVTWFYR
jgi:hypothetical protein